MNDKTYKNKNKETNSKLEFQDFKESEELQVGSETEYIQSNLDFEKLPVNPEAKQHAESNSQSEDLQINSESERTFEEEHLEQELNEFIIETFKKILPFLNSKVEKRENITLQDILDQLNIKTCKVNRCNYVFKRGIKAGKRCENICIDNKDLCVKCIKRCDKNIRIIELIPDIENENEFTDNKGIRYRRLEDKTLEVINKEMLSNKEVEKMKKLGIKLRDN